MKVQFNCISSSFEVLRLCQHYELSIIHYAFAQIRGYKGIYHLQPPKINLYFPWNTKLKIILFVLYFVDILLHFGFPYNVDY